MKKFVDSLWFDLVYFVFCIGIAVLSLKMDRTWDNSLTIRVGVVIIVTVSILQLYRIVMKVVSVSKPSV